MARGATITVENNFTRGLITEFTAMNFPENAVTEADNVVFTEVGSVSRRLGMDYETDYLQRNTNPNPESAFVEYKWQSVGQDGSVILLVQQIGLRIYFFRVTESGSLSRGLLPTAISLTAFATPGTSDEELYKNTCSFTSGDGYLFVTHPFCDPFYIEYDPATEQFSWAKITVQIRDMTGLEEPGVPIDHRPSTLTPTHNYNLLNQGWYRKIRPIDNSSNEYPALERWRAQRIDNNPPIYDWPSNADIWWLYKNVFDQPWFLDYFTHEGTKYGVMVNTNPGNTPAPKGHYIYNAFDVNRSAATGIPGLPRETSGRARPSVCCWYAGRVWYAGTSAPRYSGTLYFSQIVEGPGEFGKCYQENDPTSDTIFDLLDTDGGTISLPLIEKVVAMRVINDVLVVFGTNGIYAIRGSDSGPFRATNYSVQYVSPVGVSSHLSIIDAEGAIMWFNNDGIYALTPDQIQVGLQVTNISKQTIQSLVDSIPVANRPFIKGAYNKREQIIRWLFSDDPNLSRFQYNRMLDFNIVSKAFYTHTFAFSDRVVNGIVSASGNLLKPGLENVFSDSNELVTDLTDSPVQVEVASFVPNQEIFKFGVTTSGQFSYAELSDPDHLDFGNPYQSYLVSGYRVRGEILRRFNSTPIAFVVENVPGGSVLVSGVWDYGERESLPHQLYTSNPVPGYQVRRLKVRGKGRALQLKFQSVGNAPFKISGWSSFDTGGQLP